MYNKNGITFSIERVLTMEISDKILEFLGNAVGGNGVIVILLSIVFLVLGFVMLIKGADWFVDGASKVAIKLNVPLIVIGLTIVAFGTSAPELAVSVTSALSDNTGIAVGNVIGSNIINVLIILGMSALFTKLPLKKTTFRYEIPFVILITIVLLIEGLDGNLSKIDALILLTLFVAFFVYLIVLSKKGDSDAAEDVAKLTEKDTVLTMILFILVGLAMIVFGSDFTVTGATRIAQAIGVEPRLIGLTVVAFGTSLPELVTSVTAARKNCADIAIGNIVGSNIFNILLILCITGVVSPSPIGFEKIFLIDGLVALYSVVILWLLVMKDKKLAKAGGIVMILSYALYFVYLVLQPMIFGTV